MGIEQFLLQRAEDQGVKKGIEKGVDLKTRNVIRNARVDENISIETIARIVGLTPERVRQILDEMGIE
jgi:DNA-directed RNA polymerase sigma subunit (sigma70/sigma32)